MTTRRKTRAQGTARGRGGATTARVRLRAVREAPGAIQALLDERGRNYGDFAIQAQTAQLLKKTLREAPNWREMPPDMREALDMSMVKISRIVCGNHQHADSWRDLVGYVTLVSNRL